MQNTFNLENKVIAITGASSGFGYHFAGVLAANGATVILGARRREKLDTAVEEIKAADSLINSEIKVWESKIAELTSN